MTPDPEEVRVIEPATPWGVARDAVKRAPLFALALLSLLALVWKGGDMMERQADRYLAAQDASDDKFTVALAVQQAAMLDRFEALQRETTSRSDALQRETNRVLERTVDVLEASNKALVEFNLRQD